MAKLDYSKIFIKEACPTSIGGQAVMEGVMMQGPDRIALAMRIPSGELYLKTKKKPKESQAMHWPLIRGVVAFARSLVNGMSTLMESADILEKYAPEEYAEEPGKIESWINKKFGARAAWNFLMTTALIFAVLISVVFFIILPTWAVNFLGKWISNSIVLNLIEGLLRIAMFIAYVAAIRKMEDIKTLFRYHGAEHKTIHCFENGLELTPENAAQFYTLHPRCGTSFMVFVLLISLLLFSFLGWPNLFWRIVSRLLLIPVIAGISYELLKWAGRSDGAIVKILSYPGLMLQKLTTAEPDLRQLEVAILSLKAVLTDPDAPVIEGFVDADGNLLESFIDEGSMADENNKGDIAVGDGPLINRNAAPEGEYQEMSEEEAQEFRPFEEVIEDSYIGAGGTDPEPDKPEPEKQDEIQETGSRAEAETQEPEQEEPVTEEDIFDEAALLREISMYKADPEEKELTFFGMDDDILFEEPINKPEEKEDRRETSTGMSRLKTTGSAPKKPEKKGLLAKLSGLFGKAKDEEEDDYDLWSEGSELLSKKMPDNEEEAGEEAINEAIRFLSELDSDGYTIVRPANDEMKTLAQGIADHFQDNAKARTLARRFTNDIKTIENALKWGQATLSMVDNGRNEAVMIMSYATGLTRAELITRGKEVMREEDFEVFEQRIQARLTGTPLQYILGMTEFMGLPFRVNPSVLIPRQDTEILVEQVLRIIDESGVRRPFILDMCTGSGAIGISIAAKVRDAIVTLADTSEEALKMAAANAAINEVSQRCVFLQGDMFDALPEDRQFDIIVCNPPYIESAVIDTLSVEVKDHEPRMALDGGKDGLDYYRIIADRAGAHLKSGGILALEIGSDQAAAVKRLLMKERTYDKIQKYRDLAGLDRVIIAERK